MNKEIKCILFFMKSDEFSSFAYKNIQYLILNINLSIIPHFYQNKRPPLFTEIFFIFNFFISLFRKLHLHS